MSHLIFGQIILKVYILGATQFMSQKENITIPIDYSPKSKDFPLTFFHAMRG
jgi:hypothetical protein